MCGSISQDEFDMLSSKTFNTDKKTIDHGVVIGRFQPLHRGHEYLIRKALEACGTVHILVGSADEARSTDNPFTYDERLDFIKSVFEEEISNGKIFISPCVDHRYRAAHWYDKTAKLMRKYHTKPVLFGLDKDAETGAMLDDFRKYVEVKIVDQTFPINATDIRLKMFDSDKPLEHIKVVTENLHPFILKEVSEFLGTDAFKELCLERQSVLDYRKSWAKSPFPPVFVAVDGLCIWKDYWDKPHLLVITRKGPIGKGKYAIPGGFLEVDETLYKSCLRELVEETGLDVRDWNLAGVETIDDPKRAKRGRMITHVHHFWRKSATQPKVVAGDDAATVQWISLDKIKELKSQFFSDHYHIIEKMLPVVDLF